ncbi:hypothetical protein KJY73_03440 [Bowmanella sp. Y26]|uniref:hypothetical protein n=1 Tax=Bowmanella yangjiangensis TaxID=2811230 RepID=UPI001BDDC124|nr:hypothetical protein [Bowmanella yangjiangensis]MBT1062610.1 hypothetical protein [Bowmanella yangjiangensis]
MRRRPMPQALHEVFGEQQSVTEILVILLFALLGTACIYYQFQLLPHNLASWKLMVGLLIVADILAGFIANFSQGTNNYYAKRPSSRLVFIAIHLHLPLVAWLMGADLASAALIWAITIVSALIVNALHGSPFQLFTAAALMGAGLLVLMQLALPVWFALVSVFFMLKVMFSFAVNHYRA